MQSLSHLATLAVIVVVSISLDTAEAQRHRKKIIIGRRAGQEQPPLWSEDSNGSPFSNYDLDGDGFLSRREFFSLPLCRDPPPCDFAALAQELKEEMKVNEAEWSR